MRAESMMNSKYYRAAGLALVFAVATTDALEDQGGLVFTPIEIEQSIQTIAERATGQQEQWFTYQVMMEPDNGMPCCLIDDSKSICSLDDRTNSWSSSDDKPHDSKVLNIYFKMQDQQPDDLFLAGSECRVTGSNQQVYAIRNVTQQQSVTFLNKLTSSSKNSLRHQALAGIALHKGKEAQAVLDDIATDTGNKNQRQAIFWLGQARNEAGYTSLLPIIEDTTAERKIRRHAVFALSVNSSDRSTEKLVDLARNSPEQRIQSESIFWLAQNHESLAQEVIVEVLQNSTSRQVKKRAVFALSQLEPEQSTPALIRLIETSPDKSVRKQALFWLGQSGDDSAFEFLEKILVADSQ